MEDYVIISGKKYRKGYTTGSCAAGASKAAVAMLLSGEYIELVEIDTPAGVRLKLPVTNTTLSGDFTECAVIKDGGDDPDVTNGFKIFAKARFTDEAGVKVKAGEGIGIVTLPGLKVEVGQPAINPVPMRMILKEVQEILPPQKGVEILLSVPGGEEVAKRTFNPRLGIVGGISILGTTGIVSPMSEEAWRESIALELKMKAVKGVKSIVFAFGNYGEDFVVGRLGISNDNIIKISNFVGYMLDRAVEYGIEKILLVGHAGKLVKVAAGIFHTHSRVADARMEILAAYSAIEGADSGTVRRIYSCITTEGALDIIDSKQLNGVYNRIASNAAKRCTEYTYNKVKVGAILFKADNSILAIERTAKCIMEDFKEKV